MYLVDGVIVAGAEVVVGLPGLVAEPADVAVAVGLVAAAAAKFLGGCAPEPAFAESVVSAAFAGLAGPVVAAAAGAVLAVAGPGPGPVAAVAETAQP